MIQVPCIFTMGNSIIAQFNTGLLHQLKAQGQDVKEQLKGMLLQSLLQKRVQLDDAMREDIDILVDKYLKIVLASDLP